MYQHNAPDMTICHTFGILLFSTDIYRGLVTNKFGITKYREKLKHLVYIFQYLIASIQYVKLVVYSSCFLMLVLAFPDLRGLSNCVVNSQSYLRRD